MIVTYAEKDSGKVTAQVDLTENGTIDYTRTFGSREAAENAVEAWGIELAAWDFSVAAELAAELEEARRHGTDFRAWLTEAGAQWDVWLDGVRVAEGIAVDLDDAATEIGSFLYDFGAYVDLTGRGEILYTTADDPSTSSCCDDVVVSGGGRVGVGDKLFTHYTDDGRTVVYRRPSDVPLEDVSGTVDTDEPEVRTA